MLEIEKTLDGLRVFQKELDRIGIALDVHAPDTGEHRFAAVVELKDYPQNRWRILADGSALAGKDTPAMGTLRGSVLAAVAQRHEHRIADTRRRWEETCADYGETMPMPNILLDRMQEDKCMLGKIHALQAGLPGTGDGTLEETLKKLHRRASADRDSSDTMTRDWHAARVKAFEDSIERLEQGKLTREYLDDRIKNTSECDSSGRGLVDGYEKVRDLLKEKPEAMPL